jgi:tetratricopeptide (TPR) repeat protein
LEEAEEAYKKSVKVDPEAYEAYISMGNMYRDESEYEKAAEAYLKVLEIKPDLYEIYLEIAQVYLKEGQKLDEAQKMVNTALKANRGDSKSYEIKGQIFLAMGKKDDAKAELKKAIKYDPENKSAKELLDSISKPETQKEDNTEEAETEVEVEGETEKTDK